VPSSHLQEMRQDHLGRLRPARQPGNGRRPGRPEVPRPRQRPGRCRRRLAAQALQPRLNRPAGTGGLTSTPGGESAVTVSSAAPLTADAVAAALDEAGDYHLAR
jgi:hypothetical protein